MSSSSWHRGSPRPSRARGGGRIFSPSGRRRHRVPRARPGPPRTPRWRSRETMPDGVGLVTHGGPASRSPLMGGRPDASGRRGQTAAASQGPEGTARGGAGGWARAGSPARLGRPADGANGAQGAALAVVQASWLSRCEGAQTGLGDHRSAAGRDAEDPRPSHGRDARGRPGRAFSFCFAP